ncbi:TOBE domain-containing protein [Nocardioidaceae bacterium]|nr:TOBE domain-containing protein [Nocardioidaceae bacterium]
MRADTTFRVSEAARLLGVSDDTVRRWIDGGRLPSAEDAAGRTVVPGPDLAALALERGRSATGTPEEVRADAVSARNRFEGLVAKVTSDAVMSQVELVCGPYRVVSLMSTEAVEQLGLRPGVRAVASVKSTSVVVEVP